MGPMDETGLMVYRVDVDGQPFFLYGMRKE
jgi:hypothetical protein